MSHPACVEGFGKYIIKWNISYEVELIKCISPNLARGILVGERLMCWTLALKQASLNTNLFRINSLGKGIEFPYHPSSGLNNLSEILLQEWL